MHVTPSAATRARTALHKAENGFLVDKLKPLFTSLFDFAFAHYERTLKIRIELSDRVRVSILRCKFYLVQNLCILRRVKTFITKRGNKKLNQPP